MNEAITICNLLDCSNRLDDTAIRFTHKGKPVGGICEACLGTSTKVKVIFEMNEQGLLWSTELIQLDNKMS